MTALAESIHYAIEKQRQHAIAALAEGHLDYVAEIIGELRLNGNLIEHAINDISERVGEHTAQLQMEHEDAHAHPDALHPINMAEIGPGFGRLRNHKDA